MMQEKRYAVDFWASEDSAGMSELSEPHDTVDAAKAAALRLMKSARFAYAEIQEKNYETGEWELRERITPDDLASD